MVNAFVTLATNDGYAVGALVLAHSLRETGTQHALHVLYTEGVSSALRNQLHAVFTHASLVNILDSNDQENLALIGHLGLTFTKLHAWRLTEYEKAVFLDADTLVLQNVDELFSRPEISAAPDIGWPDYFNSGVFVFTPSLERYRELVQFGLQEGSFDGGDQGLLNKWFKDWRESDASHRLPFIYNMTAGAIYSYAAALKIHGENIKIVHFLGRQKPWHSLKTGVHGNEHWTQWNNVFEKNVKQHLPPHLLHYLYDLHSKSKHHHKSHQHPSHKHHSTPPQNLPHFHRDPSPPVQQSHHVEQRSEESWTPSQQIESNSPASFHSPPEHKTVEIVEVRRSSPPPNEPVHENIEHEEVGSSAPALVESAVTPAEVETSSNLSRHSSSSSSELASCCDSSEESGDENKWERALGDWERGAPDVSGRDAFDNILAHIQQQL
ncbi:hypothetical protein M3Y97_00278000 [Aphelenchoides bicaudatus]|nr:hypothetical protein M3Y97_00278000 [Aphelenchoides bicaudatus]